MAKYVDGFVLTVPKKNIEAYKKMAKDAGKLWRKHGALQYMECVADDMRPKGVKVTFPKLTQAKPSELVVFAFVVYKSRAHRDQVNAKVMSDPAMQKYETMPMPFSMDRMSYGGFQTIVEA